MAYEVVDFRNDFERLAFSFEDDRPIDQIEHFKWRIEQARSFLEEEQRQGRGVNQAWVDTTFWFERSVDPVPKSSVEALFTQLYQTSSDKRLLAATCVGYPRRLWRGARSTSF